jgi:ribosomal protein S17
MFSVGIIEVDRYCSYVCLVCVRVSRDVQIGDVVTIGECRPLSKTVRFNVLKVAKAAGSKKQFQKF